MSYVSNTTLTELAGRLLACDELVLTTHAKPDGDAFGSVLALARALQMAGKRARVMLMPPVPISFALLKGAQIPEVYHEGSPLPAADMYVLVDTGAWSQIAPMQNALQGVLDRLAIVDHHLSGGIPAAWRCIDGKAAACCEMIAALIDEMSRQLGRALMDGVVGELLFVGLASDTGWFRFSNTRPQTHELAARLLRMGVNQSEIYEKLEQTDRPQKLALMTRALQGMRFLANHKAALIVLGPEDFTQTGARTEETERLIDLPRTVAGVEVVALISQPPEPSPEVSPESTPELPQEASPEKSSGGLNPLVRVSFRSKPGPQAVNVAELAARFQGGGHARAAGAKLQQPLEEVVRLVSEAMVQAVEASQAVTAKAKA